MRVWMLVIAAACAGGNGANGKAGQNGASGADGQQGATGPAGPPGAPGGSYRWHDATGAQVTDGSELSVWIDDLLWSVDWQTAGIYVQPVAVTYYADDDCNGAEYTLGLWPHPRVPVELRADDESNGPIAVRPDDLLTEEVCGLESSAIPGDTFGCNFSGPGCADVVPLAAFYEVDVPVTSWVAPLHPEPIE